MRPERHAVRRRFGSHRTASTVDEFVAEAERDVAEALKRLKGPGARDPEAQSEAARLAARRAAQRWSGKKPQTKVLLASE